MKVISSILGVILLTATAMIGYAIHHSLFWAIVDYIFAPIAWIKWLICHEVTLAVIKQAFAWFLN